GSRTWLTVDSTPSFEAAISIEGTNCRAIGVDAGLNTTAQCVTCGANCLSSSTHLPAILGSKFVKPVMLPPGRARLLTYPRSTGSLTPANTIGVVRVARCNAAVGPVAL